MFMRWVYAEIIQWIQRGKQPWSGKLIAEFVHMQWEIKNLLAQEIFNPKAQDAAQAQNIS